MTAVRCGGSSEAQVTPQMFVSGAPPCGWSGTVEPDWEVMADLLADDIPEASALRFALGRCQTCRGPLELVPRCVCGDLVTDHNVQDPGYCGALGCQCQGYAEAKVATSEPKAGSPNLPVHANLQDAIRAATKALVATYDWDGYDVPGVAEAAVRAAWPHAEGLIGNMRARNMRQREANGRMQRQVEDLKASARDQAAKLRAAQAEIERLQRSEAQARSVVALHQQNGCGVQFYAEGLRLDLQAARDQISEYETMIADQASGAATQHHWRATASRFMREHHELERLALAYLDADSSHAAHQEAETALREALKEARR